MDSEKIQIFFKGAIHMQIVVVKPPKPIRGILKLIFGVKTIKDDE